MTYLKVLMNECFYSMLVNCDESHEGFLVGGCEWSSSQPYLPAIVAPRVEPPP